MSRSTLTDRRAAALLVALLAAIPLLAGCPAMIAAGVVHGVIIANDERSTGAQLDDQTIEIKVTTNAAGRWGNEVHLNVTSYNGIVLLTGEAPSTIIQDEITKIAKSTDRVRIVQNEMVIGPVTDLGARTDDTYITSRSRRASSRTKAQGDLHQGGDRAQCRLSDGNRAAPGRGAGGAGCRHDLGGREGRQGIRIQELGPGPK
jgi:osmotically-inducible protein OsmY